MKLKKWVNRNSKKLKAKFPVYWPLDFSLLTFSRVQSNPRPFTKHTIITEFTQKTDHCTVCQCIEPQYWGSSLKLCSDTGGNRTRKAAHFVTGMSSVTMKRLTYFVRFVCSCSHLHCLRSSSITIDSYINMFHLLVTRKSYFTGLKISAWQKGNSFSSKAKDVFTKGQSQTIRAQI